MMHLCVHINGTQGGYASRELREKKGVSHFTWFGGLHPFGAGYVHAVLMRQQMG